MQSNICKARIKANTFEVKEELENDTLVIFYGKGSITGKKQVSNEDGTYNVVSEIKPSLLEIKVAENESEVPKPVIKDNIVKHKSLSSILRWKLEEIAEVKGLSKEGYYRDFMEDLIDKANKKLDELKGF